MPHAHWFRSFLIGILMVFGPFSGSLWAQSDHDYFQVEETPQGPPYDSAAMRFERTSLMTGHVLHNAFHGVWQLQSFDRGLGLNFDAPVLGALRAVPPVINWLNGEIHPRAIWLQHHGNNMGWLLGANIAGIFGSRHRPAYFGGPDYHLWSASTSAGLGILGYYIGKNAGWSQNRISMYKHYSTMGAYVGFDVSNRMNGEAFSTQGRAVSSLLGVLSGYTIAHFRANHPNSPDLTRGDHVATDAFTIYNTFYAHRLLQAFDHEPSIESPVSKLPYLALIGSSTLHQEMVRNARLSRGQSKVLAGVLGGAAGIQWMISNQVIDDPLNPIPMAGTYLAGNVAYKLMLDKMIDKNLKRRGGHSDARASVSLVPFAPASSLAGNQQELGFDAGKEGLFNSMAVNMTVEF